MNRDNDAWPYISNNCFELFDATIPDDQKSSPKCLCREFHCLGSQCCGALSSGWMVVRHVGTTTRHDLWRSHRYDYWTNRHPNYFRIWKFVPSIGHASIFGFVFVVLGKVGVSKRLAQIVNTRIFLTFFLLSLFAAPCTHGSWRHFRLKLGSLPWLSVRCIVSTISNEKLNQGSQALTLFFAFHFLLFDRIQLVIGAHRRTDAGDCHASRRHRGATRARLYLLCDCVFVLAWTLGRCP